MTRASRCNPVQRCILGHQATGTLQVLHLRHPRGKPSTKRYLGRHAGAFGAVGGATSRQRRRRDTLVAGDQCPIDGTSILASVIVRNNTGAECDTCVTLDVASAYPALSGKAQRSGSAGLPGCYSTRLFQVIHLGVLPEAHKDLVRCVLRTRLNASSPPPPHGGCVAGTSLRAVYTYTACQRYAGTDLSKTDSECSIFVRALKHAGSSMPLAEDDGRPLWGLRLGRRITANDFSFMEQTSARGNSRSDHERNCLPDFRSGSQAMVLIGQKLTWCCTKKDFHKLTSLYRYPEERSGEVADRSLTIASTVRRILPYECGTSRQTTFRLRDVRLAAASARGVASSCVRLGGAVILRHLYRRNASAVFRGNANMRNLQRS